MKDLNELAEPLAEHIYNWLSEQKYGDEELLHAAVCCDYVGMIRFKKAITKQIEIFMNKKNLRRFLKRENEKI